MPPVSDKYREIEDHLPEPPMRPENFDSGGKFLRFIDACKEAILFWGPILLFGSLILYVQFIDRISFRTTLFWFANIQSWGSEVFSTRFLTALAFSLASVFFLLALKMLKLKRQTDITPTSRIRSMAMGMVEVKGRARRMYDLHSPLTGTPCVYYRLRKYRNGFLEYEQDSSHVPFCIEDDSGRVAIDPVSARIVPKLRRYGAASDDGPLTWTEEIRNLREDYYVEDILFDTVDLFVLGYAVPYRKEPSESLSQRTREALFRLKRNKGELFKFDRDGNGAINTEEWDEARRQTEQGVLHKMLDEQLPKVRNENYAMIVNPAKSWLPFIIAEERAELEVGTRFMLAALSLLTAGFVLLVWGVSLVAR